MADLQFEVDTAGLITVDSVELKDVCDNAWKQGISQDLDMSSSTPQGRISLGTTAILENIQGKIAPLSNIGNIFYAQGGTLTALASSFGYFRKSQVLGTVLMELTVKGDRSFALIRNPNGKPLIVVSDGNLEYAYYGSKVYIPIPPKETDKIYLTFIQTSLSEEVSKPNTINQIVSADGFQDSSILISVNNPNYSIAGVSEESDEDLKKRMGLTGYAGRTLALPESCVARISNLDGVLSTNFAENKDSVEKVVDDITLPPHSMVICVDGGNDTEIARQISIAESQGCTYVGNTDVYCNSKNERYTYSYKIQRPTYTQLSIALNVNTLSDEATASAETSVKDAISLYFSKNYPRLGQVITAADIIYALENVPKTIFSSVSFSYGDTTGSMSATPNVDEVFVIDINNITVNATQVV